MDAILLATAGGVALFEPMVVCDGMSKQFQSQVHDMGVKNMSMPVTRLKMDLLGIRTLLCLGSVE